VEDGKSGNLGLLFFSTGPRIFGTPLLLLRVRARRRSLHDLEGFEMSPGQDIPAAIKTLAVSAPKIERGSARRIGHQNNG
jgi:hypothetical protein